ncbi:MAG TPA: hypothetical protein DCR27_01595 [Lachnospiraceae bacterium]|nr:hypothetical protein [Lachnospiraceae bacterium]
MFTFIIIWIVEQILTKKRQTLCAKKLQNLSRAKSELCNAYKKYTENTKENGKNDLTNTPVYFMMVI